MEGSGKNAGKSSSYENKKPSSASHGKPSSIFADLFDNKKSSSSSNNPNPTSSSELFDSLFSTPSTIRGRESSHSWNIKPDSQGDPKRAKEGYSRDRNATHEIDIGADPCHLSSSIYYGCQDYHDVNNDSSNPRTYQPPLFKKDGDEDDSSGTNLYSASRGNWWEGSLYY